MLIDVVGGLLLLLVFVLGTVTRVNIGALALVAAFVLGTLHLGEDAAEVLSGFPATFFVLIFGVTYLFSVASANGTLDWLITSAARLVGGRALAVPIALFGAATLMTAAGAPGQAAAAFLAPIGIRLGRQFGLSPFVTGIMVILGVVGGSFSPINVLAIVANESVTRGGLEAQPILLFLGCVAASAVTATAVLVFMHVRRARGAAAIEDRSPDAGTGAAGPELAPRPGATPAGGGLGTVQRTGVRADLMEDLPRAQMTLPIALTLLAFVLVVLSSIVGGLDLGLVALSSAVVLHLAFPRKDAMATVAWDVILLICGLVTLIAVLERAGTITRVGEGLAGLGAPLVAALLICFAAALVSAFASSTATIGATVPLAIPLVTDGGIGLIGLLIAICLCSTLVDASPLSSAGALVVAGAPAEVTPRLYRQLLTWGMAMIVVAPVLTVAAFVLPGL